MKKVLPYFAAFILFAVSAIPGRAAEATDALAGMQTPHAIVMEVSTGKILYEKDADAKVHPASVTKVMTVLLVFEALEKGQITLDQEVVTSAHAKSMGGSQVFLEEGEIHTVETLLPREMMLRWPWQRRSQVQKMPLCP